MHRRRDRGAVLGRFCLTSMRGWSRFGTVGMDNVGTRQSTIPATLAPAASFSVVPLGTGCSHRPRDSGRKIGYGELGGASPRD